MNVTNPSSLFAELDYLGPASGYADEVYDAISEGPLFDHFDRHDIEALCQFMHCYAAERGRLLVQEGESGDFVLIVLSGSVDVRKIGARGQQISVAVVEPGGTIGEMSLIDGERRCASCVAIAPTDVAVLRRSDLNEILVAHPRLANKLLIRLMQVLVGRLRDTGDRLLAHYFSTAV